MEARDALPDDVQVRRPEPLVARIGEARRRQVVDQGVEPDVHGLLRVAGEGNAPRLPLPRDRDVLEAGLEQAHHLVATDLGLDREAARPDALEHRIAVGAQPKEVVALLRRNQLERGVLDAVAVDDLRAGLELLAAGAVQSGVLRLVQVVGVALANALEQGGDGAGVARLRGADPIVVTAAEATPVVGERGGHAVGPRLRR